MAQRFINGETPAGIVNGSNKIFTTSFDIDKIDDILIGGADYRDYTFSGNTITLADAPPSGYDISVDYFPLVDSSNTLNEIIERIYKILGELDTSTIYDRDKTIIPMINEYQEDILKGEVVDIVTGLSIKGGHLRFKTSQYHFNNVPHQKSQSISAGDIVITIGDTTNFNSSGFLYINGNIVEYTGKNATQFTGVTGIEIDHPAGSIVKQVWKLPIDITRPFELKYINTQGSGTNYITKRSAYVENNVDYVDYRAEKDIYYYYTLYPDNFSDSGWYLYINGYNSIQDRFILHYNTINVEMVNGTDRCELPGKYGVKVLAPLVAGELLYDSEEPKRGELILKQAYSKLKTFYNFYSKIVRSFRPKVKINALMPNLTHNRYIRGR